MGSVTGNIPQSGGAPSWFDKFKKNATQAGTWLSGKGSDSIFPALTRAGIGAGIGAAFAPKYNAPTPVSLAQLNASTMPQIQRQNNARLAYLNGAQGAKGGLSSADMFQNNDLRRQIGNQEATQLAYNQISANQAAQTHARNRFEGQTQRFNNIMSGGLAGLNAGNNPFSQSIKQLTPQQLRTMTPQQIQEYYSKK